MGYGRSRRLAPRGRLWDELRFPLAVGAVVMVVTSFIFLPARHFHRSACFTYAEATQAEVVEWRFFGDLCILEDKDGVVADMYQFRAEVGR